MSTSVLRQPGTWSDWKPVDRELVEQAIERFARTGAGDVKMLAGEGRQLRLRAGDWRIRFVYELPDIIRILHIRHRREAYR